MTREAKEDGVEGGEIPTGHLSPGYRRIILEGFPKDLKLVSILKGGFPVGVNSQHVKLIFDQQVFDELID